MSALLDLRDKLQETHAALARVENEAGAQPDDESLSLIITSLRKRQEDLERAFSQAADLEHVDLCSYRLIADEGDRYSVSALTSALGAFQDLLTVVFDSIKNGPKVRPRLSPEIVEQTSFDFGYAYPGSLGLVLTMPNERLLIGESDLDKAISAIFEMAKAKDPEQVASYAREFGVAAIRRLYKWSESHSRYRVSADIRWRRKNEERANIVVQTKELESLQDIIAKTSDDKEEPISVEGELIGIDVGKRNFFHMGFPDADDLTGRISERFDREPHYEIHGIYTAHLLKRTKIHYSMDREEELWELLSLETRAIK